MGLKSFFAKLLGKTDDVAKLATTYGDDVAEGVAKYQDEVVDFTDLPPFSEPPSDPVDLGTGKLFHFGEYGTPEGSLKNDLLHKRLAKIDPDYPREIIWEKSPSEVRPEFGQNVSFEDYINFPKQTSYLGDVDARFASMPDGSYTTLPLNTSIPTSQLVIQSPEINNYKNIGLRPHNNTALGRWFRKQMPNYGVELDIDSFKF